MEIPLLAAPGTCSPADLAFIAAALDVQLREHWAPAYGVQPIPVVAYSTLDGLPAGTFEPLVFVPPGDLGVDGALGFHDWIGGRAYGRIAWSGDPLDGTTASHEALEMAYDPLVNLWLPVGTAGSLDVAAEICDPCEADSYTIQVTIGDETRGIRVSDFVLPAWFQEGAPGPYTYLDTCGRPFGLSRTGSGYCLVRDARTLVVSERFSDLRSLRACSRKLMISSSRVARRLKWKPPTKGPSA